VKSSLLLKRFPAILGALAIGASATTRADEPAGKVGTHQDAAPAPVVSETAPCESAPEALPNFGGPLCERPYLTGDWLGIRSCLAERGIMFTGDVTQYYQGVTSGGTNREFEYGGHADFLFNTDMEKFAGLKGLFLKVRAETQFGQFVNRDTGALLPVNTSGMIPVVDEHEFAVTDVLFTQFLSETFGVFIGKMDTLDGDQNAFASGRGKTQFMNTAFVFNPVAMRTVPYSTLGAGFVILRDKQPIFTFSAIDAKGSPTTIGIDEFSEEGMTLTAELRLPTCCFGMPGHQLFGATWSDRNVAILDQNIRLILPPPFGTPPARANDSWSFYYNFDQYLFVDQCDPTRGWGVFARAGIGDEETNPLHWFASVGLGGNSPISCREHDTWGVGYYHAGASDDIPAVLNVGDGNGVELFYNVEVTPWFHLTPDLQVIESGFGGIPALGLSSPDTAVVLGLRGKIDF
jgi:porin